jgi:hypothetical protein
MNKCSTITREDVSSPLERTLIRKSAMVNVIQVEMANLFFFLAPRHGFLKSLHIKLWSDNSRRKGHFGGPKCRWKEPFLNQPSRNKV